MGAGEMTKKRPDHVWLKLEMPDALWKRFDRALRLHEMTRSKAMLVRQMVADFCDMAEEQFEKKKAKISSRT